MKLLLCSLLTTLALMTCVDALAAEITTSEEILLDVATELETVADILVNINDPMDVEAAREAISNARIAILVAQEELANSNLPNKDAVRSVLNEATQAVLVAGAQLEEKEDEFDDVIEDREPGLDNELDESLIVFEEQIVDARATILGSSAGSESSAEGIPGDLTGAILVESGGGGDVYIEGNEEQDENTLLAGGRLDIPGDIPDAQDDDIVARQLREAAMAETDPDLREKLWDEYRRYKDGL